MNLVIVESPAKAKTINKYLGDNYKVLASYGHIRDLPSKNGSVDPDQDFKMEWEIDSFSKKYLKEITDAAKDSSKIILATDPDREGEAIAWHVKEYLNEKKLLKDKEIERVVFNEITKKAVIHGIENPRQIEPLLVDAYMARRALDYLVGFNISPILWTKLPGSKSAGRVQSVALKLITEREHEIESFKPEEFWTLSVKFKDEKNQNILASISQLDNNKVEKFSFRNKDEINKAISSINQKKFNITDISSKVVNRNPSGPFTTSTLQQTASSRLGFGASRTMQIAQKLYQGVDIEGETIGLITYMRTDGTNLSKDAVVAFRDYIKKEIGNEYLPESALNYSGKKAKNAQEAHEAIRPTDIIRTPQSVKKYLSTDQNKLYDLIWSRALSSQMQSAKFDRNTITITSNNNDTVCKASGSVLKFDGFLKIYNNQGKDDDENILPSVSKGLVNIESLIDEQHFTQPPPRYSEASLVKKLEELGIGRPSTYASIISTIANRGYAEILNKRFFPTDRGKLISAFLEKLFSKYVDYNFTAGLEDQLDEITTGKESWIKVLELFWKDFNNNVSEVKEKRTREVLDLLNDSLGDLVFDKDDKGNIVRKCQLCNSGTLSLKNSFRGGAFIGCSNYPECKFTRPLSKAKAAAQAQLAEPKFIGKHENGNDIYLKNGRFGPYLQYEKIPEDIEVEKTPKKKRKAKKTKSDVNELLKNVSIPKGLELDSIDLEKAQFLCSLPKSLGINPDNQKEITLNTGRFGPYLKCENKSARIENIEEIFSIGLNRAVTLIAEAKPGRMSSSMIKDLGEHPEDKKPVRIMKGQYGPYIKYKSLNATIPEEKDPTELTMEEALILIEKRREYDKTKKKKKKK
ncbi:type I DNA topoisomerase [Candidatus Pelagibacter sp. RS39]|uniref:type I DNA topoisomerase n=1 Tax=Candidatus Pelagibacter sp. RS39 TaxID=1977864 RepID=UPI000A1650EC|nr:type I DNA topoisomerase [Candidatus Pelagibacter sp. RS39]ARJ47938.1 DNA topoisomerase I [Candidatus Pelagibacter sp. RS39]